MKIKRINTPTMVFPWIWKVRFPVPEKDEGETVASRGFSWMSDMGLLNQIE
jgi:hypothetical protein